MRSESRFDAERDRLIAETDLAVGANLPPRESRKMDRFSLLTLAAVRPLVARLSPGERAACGLFVGNMLAGWTFTEPQIHALHTQGPGAVSAYLATAWFPAAAQGHVTIALGLHGIAKTVTTDRCSGGQAIGMAYHRLRHGPPGEVMLAGGVEAPVTPLVCAAQEDADRSSRLAEASAFLLLRAGTAPAGAPIIGAHVSFRRSSEDATEERLRAFLERLPHALPLEAVVCDAPPWSAAEQAVHALSRRILGATPRLLAVGRAVGDALGAGSALAAALACEVLQSLPPGRSVIAFSLGHQCADLLWLHT
ncbi:beta-ketoacyl synthase N-terminal-like domain-containing protein [Corallococcus sp. EGB]|uniref:beta-ketoacyl synthase N-terminal-like domain-containing protein n=1 Tax=Corallococcus sp. EGB TaxID=1521117 RepID=UPI001CBC964E|nr:beta-ketoacyl synthase N-terminal-like domain-containing protein [Corallococcus sp. EGB]